MRANSLVEYFLSEANGCPMLALRLAVATCEAMALGTSGGYLRLPPTHAVRQPKPQPEPPL